MNKLYLALLIALTAACTSFQGNVAIENAKWETDRDFTYVLSNDKTDMYAIPPKEGPIRGMCFQWTERFIRLIGVDRGTPYLVDMSGDGEIDHIGVLVDGIWYDNNRAYSGKHGIHIWRGRVEETNWEALMIKSMMHGHKPDWDLMPRAEE